MRSSYRTLLLAVVLLLLTSSRPNVMSSCLATTSVLGDLTAEYAARIRLATGRSNYARGPARGSEAAYVSRTTARIARPATTAYRYRIEWRGQGRSKVAPRYGRGMRKLGSRDTFKTG